MSMPAANKAKKLESELADLRVSISTTEAAINQQKEAINKATDPDVVKALNNALLDGRLTLKAQKQAVKTLKQDLEAAQTENEAKDLERRITASKRNVAAAEAKARELIAQFNALANQQQDLLDQLFAFDWGITASEVEPPKLLLKIDCHPLRLVRIDDVAQSPGRGAIDAHWLDHEFRPHHIAVLPSARSPRLPARSSTN